MPKDERAASGLSREAATAARALAEAATGAKVVRLARLRGGLANTMVVATLDRARPVVIRLPRSPRPARWIAIEAAVMERAAVVVPVPDVLLVDADGSVAGAAGMVMAFVDGKPGRHAVKRLDDVEARSLGRGTGVVLGALGDVTFDQAGYFVDAMLEPASTAPADVLDAFVSTMHRAPPPHAVDDKVRAAWDVVCERWPAIREAMGSGRSLVHGDANANNFLVGGSGATLEVVALIDWEFSFSGSALFDLAALLRAAARRPPAFSEGVIEGYEHRANRLPDGWREATTILADLQISEFACGLPRSLSPIVRWFARQGVVG